VIAGRDAVNNKLQGSFKEIGNESSDAKNFILMCSV
jgi:hypothetical protein